MTEAVVARRNKVEAPASLGPRLYQASTRMPGFNKFSDTGLIFEASGANLRVWEEVFPDVKIVDADGTIARRNMAVSPIEPYERKLAPTIPPFAHQTRAINVAMAREYYGFFHGLGTGKTHTMINIAAELFAAGKIKRALIVTQKRAMPQIIASQLPAHMPKGVDYSAACVPLKKREQKEWAFPKGRLLIMICNHGSFQSAKHFEEIRAFCAGAPTVGLIDESQGFKGWSTLRVDNLLKLKPELPYRYLFSGEPKPLGYVDLFAQFYFMNPDIIGHAGIGSFRNEYCIMGRFGDTPERVVDYRDQERLVNLIAPHCEFVDINDCQDMPERSWHEASFEPTQEQRDIYMRLKEEFVAEIERAGIEPNIEVQRKICVNAAAKLSAMRQVACGWFYESTEDGGRGPLAIINDERALFTIEEYAMNAPKSIVWAAHHADLDSIARVLASLGIEGVEFSGRVADVQAEANKQRFIHDPKCRVFYGTAASGGTGLDGLQVASHMTFFNNTFNWGQRAQAEGRTYRTGQKAKCVYVDIIGFPVDRLVLKNLQAKRDMSAELVNLAALASIAKDL